MAVNKVDLHVSQIIEDLNNGLTWLKKDDLGYGSIQDKYGAKDQQIAMIRKHPKLKDAETTVTVFNIIDDTKDETSLETKQSSAVRTSDRTYGSTVPVVSESTAVEVIPDDSFSAFANL